MTIMNKAFESYWSDVLKVDSSQDAKKRLAKTIFFGGATALINEMTTLLPQDAKELDCLLLIHLFYQDIQNSFKEDMEEIVNSEVERLLTQDEHN